MLANQATLGPHPGAMDGDQRGTMRTSLSEAFATGAGRIPTTSGRCRICRRTICVLSGRSTALRTGSGPDQPELHVRPSGGCYNGPYPFAPPEAVGPLGEPLRLTDPAPKRRLQ